MLSLEQSEETAASVDGLDSSAANAASTSGHINTETALQCLFRLRIRRGTFVETAVFKRQHGLPDRLDIDRLQPLGQAFGFELQVESLDWPALVAGKFSEPVMLVLDNGNIVLVMGVQTGEVPRLAIADPLAEFGASRHRP